ncbi:MAG: DDE-type integrase/transposase/recombinase, partial [Candidatus Marinimicrobia bacterium]|nr:DDE-type integrase/transposase/recombinase [Candidatus Neomarinimicrobiota bacterium]
MISIADLDDRQRQVAYHRADLLSQLTALRNDGFTAAQAQQNLGLKAATVSRWNKAFAQYGVAGLADQAGKRRGGKSKMSKSHRMFLYKTALTQHKPKMMSIYREEYMVFCASLAEQPVSYTTFNREFKRIPEPVKTLYRKGSKAFADSMPHHMRDWNLVKPMEVIFSDHVMLNFFVNVNGKEVRPWVTWWMDGHSRKALGWVVTLKPSQDTIMLSLLHAIKKYGTPISAYTDNGKDYKSI